MDSLISLMFAFGQIVRATSVFNLFIWRLNMHTDRHALTVSPGNLKVAGGLEVLGNLVDVLVSIYSAQH